ncbi:MAG: exosome complex RNA-binding protein Rrp4 [Candidatus Nanoarchaeia archaeon]|nr:exosome complex RNA-binding protein Rrp4 [Candidatus Nanoarchaeia archaeon]
MGKLLVEDKTIATPGEKLAEGMDFLPDEGTFREKDKILAAGLGLVSINGRLIKVIPVSGRYLPNRGDVIIGKITDILMSGWTIDINSSYNAILSVKEATDFIRRDADLTKYYDIGDYIITKIVMVTSQCLVDVSMKGPGVRKLTGGRVIKVNAHKVPRIIGKRGSMVSMIKNATECNIIVGQNGVVWINGSPENEIIVINTIRKIEQEAHISGLTERIREFLEKTTKKKIEIVKVE